MPLPASLLKTGSRCRCRGVSRLLPSLSDFAALTPVIFLFGRMGGVATLLGDGDTGWHIRCGEWILANGRVPRQDIFSFTRPNAPWYAWEWLSDVLMGLLHHAGGMQAVLFGALVLLCLIFGLLYRLVFLKSGNVVIAFGLTALSAAASSIHWLARPHLFTMLFLILFCRVLEARQIRLLWLLPSVSVLWSNLHGGFLAGILTISAWAAGEFITALTAQKIPERSLAIRRGSQYALTAAGCLIASLLNPYGWHLHRHIVEFLVNPDYFRNISEFVSINFRHPLAGFFELLLWLGMASALWCIQRRRFTDALLLLGFGHLALGAARNIPLFAMAAAPAIGRAMADWLHLSRNAFAGTWIDSSRRAFEWVARRVNAASARPQWHIAVPAALVAVAAIMYMPAPPPQFRAQYSPRLFPVAAAAHLGDSDRVFSTDTWGGYLLYRRYPAKVSIDGRSDFYGPEFETAYAQLSSIQYSWELTLRTWDVNTILWPVDSPLTGAVKLSSRWRLDYDDGVAAIFRVSGYPAPPASNPY